MSRCFGLENEKKLLPILQRFFNDDTIKKTPFIRHPFDFVGDNGTLYELKTRTCCYNRYPDTIFPAKKLNYQPDAKKYLIFSFTDDNYFIEYNKEVFETFKKDTKQYRFDRGALDKPAEYINIPIDKLTKMNA